MLDSVPGRGPGMAFIPYCSLPELEACMEVWGFMEMIHSRSYTYIIKNVYSDPSEVFDKIVSDERILERSSSVTEAYDDFINSAHQWDTGKMWSDDFKDSPTAQWEIKDVKEENSIERWQMSTSLKEFVSMLVSLVLSPFGELKLMEGSAKIISLIARDENQHLAITQNILNKWKQVMIQK